MKVKFIIFAEKFVQNTLPNDFNKEHFDGCYGCMRLLDEFRLRPRNDVGV